MQYLVTSSRAGVVGTAAVEAGVWSVAAGATHNVHAQTISILCNVIV